MITVTWQIARSFKHMQSVSDRLEITVFPVWAPALKWLPGLEGAPGQKRTLWSFAFYIMSLVWTQCQTSTRASVRNCCLSCSPKPVDLMEDQQLYNLDGPLDQQHFIVTKLQYKYSLHFGIIYRVFHKFILWRTTHFFSGPTLFLNYWSLDQALILLKVEHWPGHVNHWNYEWRGAHSGKYGRSSCGQQTIAHNCTDLWSISSLFIIYLWVFYRLQPLVVSWLATRTIMWPELNIDLHDVYFWHT